MLIKDFMSKKYAVGYCNEGGYSMRYCVKYFDNHNKALTYMEQLNKNRSRSIDIAIYKNGILHGFHNEVSNVPELRYIDSKVSVPNKYIEVIKLSDCRI